MSEKSYTKTMNHKGEITPDPDQVFEFFGKVRFPGEKRFFFEGTGGTVATTRLHAVHRPYSEFDKAAQSLAEHKTVSEYRVYQNVEGNSTPRLVMTYTFDI